MKVRRTLAAAAAHLVLTTALLVASFGVTMARFDQGRAPTPGERVVETAAEVLRFPLVTLALAIPDATLMGLLGGTAWFANSLLWGAAIVFCSDRLRSRIHAP